MPRFLIEVPHDSDEQACTHFINIFLATGSHYLTHADWGCMDGHHTAWITVECDNKDQARMILPAAYRPQAKIVALNKFRVDKGSLQVC